MQNVADTLAGGHQLLWKGAEPLPVAGPVFFDEF